MLTSKSLVDWITNWYH